MILTDEHRYMQLDRKDGRILIPPGFELCKRDDFDYWTTKGMSAVRWVRKIGNPLPGHDSYLIYIRSKSAGQERTSAVADDEEI